MSEILYSQYDWVLSLLAQRIAADVIIQEGAITRLKDSKVLTKGLKRCQLHTRLLQLVLQARKSQQTEGRSADLVELLQSTRSSSADIVRVEVERTKPMLNVLADPDQLDICLRIIVILLLLEDSDIRRILVSLRCRAGYVSVRIKGGKVRHLQLLDKELIAMVYSTLRQYGANMDWKVDRQKRLVYLRLNLSSQLNLI